MLCYVPILYIQRYCLYAFIWYSWNPIYMDNAVQGRVKMCSLMYLCILPLPFLNLHTSSETFIFVWKLNSLLLRRGRGESCCYLVEKQFPHTDNFSQQLMILNYILADKLTGTIVSLILVVPDKPANSTRIRESIMTTILVTFGYENQFPPLNCA